MNRKQKDILIILANLLIWGFASWRIFFSDFHEDDPGARQSNNNAGLIAFSKVEKAYEKLIERKKNLAEYQPGNPDPFGGYDLLPLKTNEEKNIVTAEKETITTQLRLTGVLWDEKEPYVFLIHTNGQHHTKKTGDVIEGEKILKIAPDHILTIKDGQRFKVTTSGFERLD